MVYIKRVTIQSFKSFGPKRVIIKPEKSFIVITGPNGGGKSNVLDAIKFCLGELSNNALRVGKLSDLIHEHNGRRLGQASVSLQLDNSDKALPVDTEEVTISRTILNNGESIYKLNGKTVTRNELLALLGSANIRPGGFNIITQGSVLSIAEKSPEELRKIIDEVAGTSEYDRRRAEAMRELELAEKNVAIAKAGLGELRNRVKQLEVEWCRLIRHRLISRYIAQLKRQRLQVELEELNRKLLALVEEERKLEGRRVAAQKNVEEFTSMRHDGSARLREVESELLSIQSRLNELRTQIRRSGSSIESIKSYIRSEASRYVSSKRGLFDAEKKIQLLFSEVAALNQENQLVERSYSQIKALLTELEQKLKEMNERRERILRTLTNWRKIQEDKERGKSDTLRELNRLEANLRLTEQRISDAKLSISEVENSLARIGEARLRLENELLENRDRIEFLDNRLRQLSEDSSSLRSKIKSEIERGKKIKKLVEELAMIKAEIGGILESLQTRPSEAQNRLKVETNGRPLRLRDIANSSKIATSTLSTFLQEYGEAWIVDRDGYAQALAELAAQRGLRLSAVSLESANTLEQHAENCLPCRLAGRDELLSKILHTIFPQHEWTEDGRFKRGKPAISRDGVYFNGRGFFQSLAQVGKRNRLEKMLSEVMQTLDNVERIERRIGAGLEKLEASLRQVEEERMNLEAERKEKANQATKLVARIKELAEEESKLSGRLVSLRKDIDDLTSTREILSVEVEALRKKLEEYADTDYEGPEDQEKQLTLLNSEINSLVRTIGEGSVRLRALEQSLSRINARMKESAASIESLQNELGRLSSEAKASIRRLQELTRLYLEVWRRELEGKEEFEKLSMRGEQLLRAKNELVEKLASIEERLEAARAELLSFESQAKSLAVARVELSMTRSSILEKLSTLTEKPVEDLSLLPTQVLEVIGSELESELASVEMVNQLARNQYSDLIVEFKSRSEGVAELDKERKAILEIIESLDAKKLEVFMRTFRKVSEDFGRYFTALTGGTGWLEFSSPDKPLESGVEMYVAFPGKSAMPSRSISGGEKSVSAVALLMAFQGLTPADFLIMDEVDAHMDANYSRNLADLLKEFSKRTQVIAVSLKDVIAEKADQLIGVYNQDGESKVVVTKLEESQA